MYTATLASFAAQALSTDVVQWYAVHTAPRHEKKVAEHLNAKGVEVYLPLYTAVRRWEHRRAEVNLPLFPGYVFNRIALCDRLQVLEVPGVVGLVGSGSRPVPLPETDIHAIRTALLMRRAEPHAHLTAGKRVRICTGPLAGIEGVIQRRKGCTRLILSIDCISGSMAIELEAEDVELSATNRFAERCHA